MLINFNSAILFCYFFYIICTPYNRFLFLFDIRAERLIVILLFFSLFFTKVKPKILLNTVFVSFLFFFLTCFFSYLVSEYKIYNLPVRWANEYWKYLVIYILITLSLDDKNKLNTIMITFVFIVFCYQIWSWKDFLFHGAYVWQQGLKRMVGVWSGGGLGSPNAWGSMSLFFMPFGFSLLSCTQKNKFRIVLIGFIISSIMCVVASGTRAAMISMVFLFLMQFRAKLKIIYMFLGIIFLVLITHLFLPDYLKVRYLQFMYPDLSISDTKSHEIANLSAHSRIEGLVDGYYLFLESPVFGKGPGSSAYARMDYKEYQNTPLQKKHNEDELLQLHNLYGQLISETGALGTFFFSACVFLCFMKSLKISRYYKRNNDLGSPVYSMASALVVIIPTYSLYGMASHTAYNHYWVFIFILSSSLHFIWRDQQGI